MINEKHVRKFCRDDISKIENYEEAVNDKTHTWELHHRLELTLLIQKFNLGFSKM